MSYSSYGIEKGQLVKVPAIANLFIDSDDRDISVDPDPYSFQIYKQQALVSGFFSRIGCTEVNLDWCENNVPVTWANAPGVLMNRIVLDISGTGGNTYVSPPGGTGFQIPPGNYTLSDCLDSIAAVISLSSAITGITASVSTTTLPGIVTLDLSGGVASFVNPYNSLPDGLGNYSLGTRLGFTTFGGEPNNVFGVSCSDIRLTKYLDIVCEQLTQVQDVHDTTTSQIERNVIVRWYMSEDTPENRDQYGFPILMGYQQFHRRRIFNPPKQIKWDGGVQLGSLTFQCFDDRGKLMITTESDARSAVALTLQLSEG